jgi:Fe-S-cluster containining protein
MMLRDSAFSYQCNQCGRCCHEQVITLSPVDVIGIARAAGIATGKAIARFTSRRGSLLKYTSAGGCVALMGTRCGLHHGRPLACRLYPLGFERDADGSEHFVHLTPAPLSAGVHGIESTVGDFITAQGVQDYLALNEQYVRLLEQLRNRIGELVDFEQTEPREFWRCAVREALAESNFDQNFLIDALFDADAITNCFGLGLEATVAAHIATLRRLIDGTTDGALIAAAAVMLAISLGYPPTVAMTTDADR